MLDDWHSIYNINNTVQKSDMMGIGKEFFKKWEHILLSGMLLLFLLVAGGGLFVVREGDENVYMYMGKLVSQGQLPYQDFFFAHPPLQIIALSPIFLIGGYHPVLLKLLALLPTMASGIIIYLTTKKLHNGKAGLIAATLFLSSYSVLFNATILWGIELAAMLVLCGYLFLLKEKPFLAGIFLGLACLTRLLALVAVAIIIAERYIMRKKESQRAALGFAAGFAIPVLPFALFIGKNFFHMVFFFHFLKPVSTDNNLLEYLNIISLNLPLFVGAGLFLALAILRKTNFSLPLFIGTTYLLIFLLVKTLYGHYFLLAFPFLAVMGGIAIWKCFEMMQGRNVLRMVAVALIISAWGWNFIADATFLSQEGFQGFRRAEEISQYVAARISPDIRFVGDESITPLLALLSGRDIAFNAVDTNDQTFTSGVQSAETLLEKIRSSDSHILFVARSTQGITSVPLVREFLNSECEFQLQFADPETGPILLYLC